MRLRQAPPPFPPPAPPSPGPGLQVQRGSLWTSQALGGWHEGFRGETHVQPLVQAAAAVWVGEVGLGSPGRGPPLGAGAAEPQAKDPLVQTWQRPAIRTKCPSLVWSGRIRPAASPGLCTGWSLCFPTVTPPTQSHLGLNLQVSSSETPFCYTAPTPHSPGHLICGHAHRHRNTHQPCPGPAEVVLQAPHHSQGPYHV